MTPFDSEEDKTLAYSEAEKDKFRLMILEADLKSAVSILLFSLSRNAPKNIVKFVK